MFVFLTLGHKYPSLQIVYHMFLSIVFVKVLRSSSDGLYKKKISWWPESANFWQIWLKFPACWKLKNPLFSWFLNTPYWNPAYQDLTIMRSDTRHEPTIYVKGAIQNEICWDMSANHLGSKKARKSKAFSGQEAWEAKLLLSLCPFNHSVI